MNAVVYFSCTGQSEKVAKEIAEKLSYPIYELKNAEGEFENLVAVFPVHCQGIPKAVKKFLKTVKAIYITLIATYGRASAGNAVYEAYKAVNKRVIAAAALPSRHSYNYDFAEVRKVPAEIYDKISHPSYIKIPQRFKAPFAGFLPAVRSRILIKIKRRDNCNGCNACTKACPQGAINCGNIKRNCIRCLKCVSVCPNGALKVKKGIILKSYLKKPKCEKTYIYV